MSQMKVNAMAIVHMAGLQDEKILMKNIEQVCCLDVLTFPNYLCIELPNFSLESVDNFIARSVIWLH